MAPAAFPACPRCHGTGRVTVHVEGGPDVDACPDCERRAERVAALRAKGHGPGADIYHRISSPSCELCREAGKYA